MLDFFLSCVQFSNDGCFAMITEALGDLAHLEKPLTAGPTKKGLVLTGLFLCFFAFMTDPLCHLVNGE